MPGRELAERSEGAAQVRAQLERWKFAFKVRDGIRAGLTASKTVAWVAANVDASSARRPKDKPLPHRLLFVDEKTGATWKLVQAHCSAVAE
ncbi:MAG TPA: nuclear transport factor 2 family protein [Kofleriaceae bacterium]